ncbi:unnamed protein product [Cuscuta epithymum]|uniref:HTH myb-type domain-containing protein n=1 Tax=Cuscuta epithymum TaxID=186058 RepID=A0AAV0F810_9ASTE|nr:unnamed protein product [Cuscuta epithymum]
MALLPTLQNDETSLVLSCDPKPRLKWTPQLHHRFVEAVNQLGGAEKATPKALMRVMNIDGLTLYHLKSHLQKFRLGKSHQLNCDHEYSQGLWVGADFQQSQSQESQSRSESYDGAHNHQINESMKIAQALEMQMEVQKKLQEQIQVQRQLQMRIESQGKYLQAVLKKAHEALSRYSPSVQAELSSLSTLTEIGCSLSNCTYQTQEQLITGMGCSLESSLTSSETSAGIKEDNEGVYNNSVELSLMEMHPRKQKGLVDNDDDDSGRKRNRSMASFDDFVENPSSHKRFQSSFGNNEDKFKKLGFMEIIDLNVKCVNGFDA